MGYNARRTTFLITVFVISQLGNLFALNFASGQIIQGVSQVGDSYQNQNTNYNNQPSVKNYTVPNNIYQNQNYKTINENHLTHTNYKTINQNHPIQSYKTIHLSTPNQNYRTIDQNYLTQNSYKTINENYSPQNYKTINLNLTPTTTTPFYHNYKESNQNTKNSNYHNQNYKVPTHSIQTDNYKASSNVVGVHENFIDNHWEEPSYTDLGGYGHESIIDSHHEDSKCGGVLDGFGVGTLSYKFRKPYNRYESCIWTINAFKKPMILVNITESYFRSPEDYIAVGYFNKSNYDMINSFTWMRLGRDSFTPLSVEVPGPVAFIHFVSTADNPGLGFRLTYECQGVPMNSLYNYDNYFYDGEFGIINYPPTGVQYNNNQRTTIVIKALNNNVTEPSVLNIKKVDIEESRGCTSDNLNVYVFRDGGWIKNRTFCGRYLTNQNAYFIHPRNDPMILTFKSDDSGTKSGFELLWRNFT